MLPTFVIGLREGLEAALIVGIIAAFLKKQDRADLLGWLFAGVAAAVVLCVGVGVALDVVSRELPQRQQEGLETVVGVLAVGMVTYMVIWMRRHSRELKGQLEGLAADAIAGSGGNAARAMVVMAFLAVLREGFETVVFLLAAFNEADSRATAGTGAVLGIVVATGLGYGIYRGGVRINLSRFFRATGLVLVFVAAGLVVSALHTGHEAGWYTVGQSRTVDLTTVPIIGWLLRAGSVQASLLTGMLGIQPRPVLLETIGWLVYLVPVGVYVAWPPGRIVPRRPLSRALVLVGVASAALAVVLVVTSPAAPDERPLTTAGSVSAQLRSSSRTRAVVRTPRQSPADASNAIAPTTSDIPLRNLGLDRHRGLVTNLLVASMPGSATHNAPTELPIERLSALDGGRLPLGVRTVGVTRLPVRYSDINTLDVWVAPATGRVVDWQWAETIRVRIVAPGIGEIPLSRPLRRATSQLSVRRVSASASAARSDQATLDSRSARHEQAWLLFAIAVAALLSAGAVVATGRRPVAAPPAPVEIRIPTSV
jgi:high-affinity iron transporter